MKKEEISNNRQNLYLKDNQIRTNTNISENSYTFVANANLIEGRFEIIDENLITLGTSSANKNALILCRDRIFINRIPREFLK